MSFGVVIPGRPVLTDFRPVDPTSTKFVAEVMQPNEVTDVTFFLLPGVVLPPNAGVVLYYSLPPFENWVVLGAVTMDKPSGVFRTGWTTTEGMASMLQLGVSIEGLDVVANLNLGASGVEERRAFAHRVAKDLFTFMTSFATGSIQGDMLVVPVSVLDKWLERFDRKWRLDPSWLFKD